MPFRKQIEKLLKMVSACLCQATVRKTKAGRDFCGYHLPREPEEECAICLCAMDPKQKKTWFITPCCKHAFHFKCIDKWVVQGGKNCPLCRGDLGNLTHPGRTRFFYGSDALMRLTSVPSELVTERIEHFREYYHDASTLMRLGPFHVATYTESAIPDIYVLDTSNGHVIHSNRIEIRM